MDIFFSMTPLMRGGGGKSKLGKTNIYIQCRSCSIRDQFYLPYSPELSLIVSRTPNRSPAKEGHFLSEINSLFDSLRSDCQGNQSNVSSCFNASHISSTSQRSLIQISDYHLSRFS